MNETTTARRGLRMGGEAAAPAGEAAAPIPGLHIESPSAAADPYVRILEKEISAGRGRAARVVKDVMENAPTDRIVRVEKVEWARTGLSAGVVARLPDGTEVLPSEWATGQIAERAGVPTAYLRELLAPQTGPDQEAAARAQDWRRDLAAEILTRHYRNNPGRMLVRSTGGDLRGWLSDRFRRLDCRPLLAAMTSEAEAAGAIAYNGSVTQTRVALKAILPRVVEPVPGEYMVIGCEWSNSDYGNGGHNVRAFGIRVVCLNGMTRENVMREVHLGGRLPETIELSERTYRLDTQTSESALRDVVRGAFGPGAIDRIAAEIRSANERLMTPAQLAVRTKALAKDTQRRVIEAFEGQDVINLPAGPTTWRASNAISWIARHEADDEKRLDLERLAGAVIAPEDTKKRGGAVAAVR